MKQYLLIIMAAVLFSTMAASCGKKTDDQAKMDMAKADSSMGGGAAQLYSVTIANAVMSGSNAAPGISITAGNAATKSASICVTDTSGTTTYKWRAYWGGTNDSTLHTGLWSAGGSATWCPGAYTPTAYWFPQYMGAQPTNPNPSSATNFSVINITTASGATATAYANVAGNTNANIKIDVVAGSGEPGK